MIYQVERIDRQGNPLGWRDVTAAEATVTDTGVLRFLNDGDYPRPKQTVAIFAPGTWGQVRIKETTDPAPDFRASATATTGNDQYPITTNAISHPFALAVEIERAVKDGRITYTREGEDLPATWRFID